MAATGMWTSVFVSVVFGWILLLAVTFAIPDTQSVVDTANELLPIVPFIWAQSMSQQRAEFLLFICVVAQFFCVTASITSASRMMFAFSRDRAVPGHPLWRRVAKNRVPRWSVLGVAFFAGVLMIPAIWNYFIGYAVGTAIAVIGLYIAFIIPVYLRWRKGDSWDEPRAWSLGRHYKWLDVVSILWVCLITILFVFPLYTVGQPWNDPFTVHELHKSCGSPPRPHLRRCLAKNWFKGPVRGTDEELERSKRRGSASLRCRPN
jgi:amino acid transporter